MKRARLEELAPTMWPAMRMQSMPMQSMPVAYPMMISPPMMMQQPFIPRRRHDDRTYGGKSFGAFASLSKKVSGAHSARRAVMWSQSSLLLPPRPS